MNGQFDEPCPTCRDHLIPPTADAVMMYGVVCPYCGYLLEKGTWTIDPPTGKFRDWLYSFNLQNESPKKNKRPPRKPKQWQ